MFQQAGKVQCAGKALHPSEGTDAASSAGQGAVGGHSHIPSRSAEFYGYVAEC